MGMITVRMSHNDLAELLRKGLAHYCGAEQLCRNLVMCSRCPDGRHACEDHIEEPAADPGMREELREVVHGTHVERGERCSCNTSFVVDLAESLKKAGLR